MRLETKELYPDNWQEISRACIDKYQHTCKDCNRTDYGEGVILTSHHRDYDPSNNDDDNLVCLCQGCHLRRQARDLAEATKFKDIYRLIRMGQLCFPGMKPKFPKRLTRVIEGKALATSRKTGRHAQPDSEQ